MDICRNTRRSGACATAYATARGATFRSQSRPAGGRARAKDRRKCANSTSAAVARFLNRQWMSGETDNDDDQRRRHADRCVRQTAKLDATATQKVVIVNGNTEMLDLLETVLDAGHYDVVFVESSEHAYSQIKRVQPNLVILCVQHRRRGRLPGAVDAEARRGHARHSGAHLHDRRRRRRTRRTRSPEPSDVEMFAPRSPPSCG